MNTETKILDKKYPMLYYISFCVIFSILGQTTLILLSCLSCHLQSIKSITFCPHLSMED